MKQTLTFLLALIVVFTTFNLAISKDTRKIPAVNIKTVTGESASTKTFDNDGKPFIINFWATWCKPCIQELNTIKDVYDKWQKETGVKIIAVSIDDSRNTSKVAPFVKGRNWKYEVYLDPNGDLKRALNVNNPPHTLLCNSNGEIVWEHNGYAPGDEEELYNQVKKLILKEKRN